MLEQEIKFTPWEDIQMKGVISIIYTAHWYDKLMQKILKPYDISHEQLSVLRALQLSEDGPMCLKQIQERLVNNTTNTTRLVEKLRQKGLLDRKEDEQNRRMVRINITEKGLKLLDEIRQDALKINQGISKTINDEEAATLCTLLDKYRAEYKRQFNDCTRVVEEE